MLKEQVYQMQEKITASKKKSFLEKDKMDSFLDGKNKATIQQ